MPKTQREKHPLGASLENPPMKKIRPFEPLPNDQYRGRIPMKTILEILMQIEDSNPNYL